VKYIVIHYEDRSVPLASLIAGAAKQ